MSVPRWISFVPQPAADVCNEGETHDPSVYQVEWIEARAAGMTPVEEVDRLLRGPGGAVPRVVGIRRAMVVCDSLRDQVAVKCTMVYPSAAAIELLDDASAAAIDALAVSPTSVALLRRLDQFGGVLSESYNDIAAALSASRRSVVRAVKQLADRGLVTQRGSDRAGVTGVLILTGDIHEQPKPEGCHRSKAADRDPESTDAAADYTFEQVMARAKRYLNSGRPTIRGVGRRLVEQALLEHLDRAGLMPTPNLRPAQRALGGVSAQHLSGSARRAGHLSRSAT